MRIDFFKGLYDVMLRDRQAVVLTADTGATVLDGMHEDVKARFINAGIAEANMTGVAAGLASCGKIVFMYGIIPFVTLRNYEHFRVDVIFQNLNVKAVGVGAGMDYSTLGPTHHAYEDIAVMRALPGITILSPSDRNMARDFAKLAYETPGPVYVRLDRFGEPVLYPFPGGPYRDGLNFLKKGDGRLCIMATGKMVSSALKVAELLEARTALKPDVIDLYRVKPLNEKLLLRELGAAANVVTIEEHSIIGGIGSAVAEFVVDHGLRCGVTRFGLPDCYCKQYGPHAYLHGQVGLSVDQITAKIQKRIC